jgi:ArsR family transcriptional regulator
MHDLVQFAKAIADPTRVRILGMLCDGELCVCEIAETLEIPQSSLSTHLQCLRLSGVVRASKKGTWAYYSVAEWAQPVLDGLAVHFSALKDSSMSQDKERLQARLAMRQGGCCVVGYQQRIQLGEKPKK